SVNKSLMVGFNSNAATLFVGTANGGNTIGNVGIGTIDPQAALEVNGEILAQNFNGSFSGDGSGLTGLNGDAISNGVIAAAYGGTSRSNVGGSMAFGSNAIVFNGTI